jgi:hypothetical protein
MTFDNIEYLKNGNERQRAAYRTLTENSIFERLQLFSPLLTGTIPINIDIDESDLDIICYWEKKDEFANTLRSEFGHIHGFNLTEQVINNYETVLACFWLDDFEIEIFGQNQPTKEQDSFRHMVIEYQILRARGEAFRQEIIKLKQDGLKTEPAFGRLLGFERNPYEELLNYKLTDSCQ